jgi:hypothetical protein
VNRRFVGEVAVDGLGHEGRRVINVYGKIYTLKGMASRSQKFPMLVERNDGKGFKLPLSAVKAALGYKVEPQDVYVGRDD